MLPYSKLTNKSIPNQSFRNVLKNRVRQTKSLLSGRLKVNQSEISAEIDGLDAINDYDHDN